MSPARALFGSSQKFEREVLCDIIRERAQDRFLLSYNFDVTTSSFVCCSGGQTSLRYAGKSLSSLATPLKSTAPVNEWIFPAHASDKSMKCFRPKLPLREIQTSNSTSVLLTPKKTHQTKITDAAGFTPKKPLKKLEKQAVSL